MGFFVFDHHPPLGLREAGEDPNDPDRLAAICWTCNEHKTSKDLKEIARYARVLVRFVGTHAQYDDIDPETV